MPSKVYNYYHVQEDRLACSVCAYHYALDAHLSTLKKHIRVKHGFSIRHPPRPADNFLFFIPAAPYARIDVKSLLNPESPAPPCKRPSHYRFIHYHV